MNYVLIFVTLFCVNVFGQLGGHNFTPTTSVLKANSWTAGSAALGYGITDELSVSTSPFLLATYNMASANLRFTRETDFDFHAISGEIKYFKTFEFGDYKQESVFASISARQDVSELITFYHSFGFQHYINDERPYSLRLDSENSSKHHLHLSTMANFTLNESWGLMTEFGLLGLNYARQYLHFGFSVHYAQKWGSVQLGYSISNQMVPIRNSEFETTWFGDKRFFHPEIQIQFLL